MWRCRAPSAARAASNSICPASSSSSWSAIRCGPKSLYFRRGLIPSWSKPTLVIRNENILTPAEAEPVAPGDYIYLLAPPEKAEALDRFFVDMQPSSAPDPHLLGDFMVSGEHTLGDTRRDLRRRGRADDAGEADAGGLFRRPSRSRAEGRRDPAARRDRAGRAQHHRRPRQRRSAFACRKTKTTPRAADADGRAQAQAVGALDRAGLAQRHC